ncbi:hypothetical protein [Desertimonas flava]|nr:hypothetical protein [Desertimonas flava]
MNPTNPRPEPPRGVKAASTAFAIVGVVCVSATVLAITARLVLWLLR